MKISLKRPDDKFDFIVLKMTNYKNNSFEINRRGVKTSLSLYGQARPYGRGIEASGASKTFKMFRLCFYYKMCKI